MSGPVMTLSVAGWGGCCTRRRCELLDAILKGIANDPLTALEDVMEFRLLGVTEVRRATGPIDLPAGGGRVLLALLALRAGEPIAAERLIDELWNGAPPATAATVVHGLVSKLRRMLSADSDSGQQILATAGKGYR